MPFDAALPLVSRAPQAVYTVGPDGRGLRRLVRLAPMGKVAGSSCPVVRGVHNPVSVPIVSRRGRPNYARHGIWPPAWGRTGGKGSSLRYQCGPAAAWRMVPGDLPPWQTVYGYFRDWSADGMLDRVHDALREQI